MYCRRSPISIAAAIIFMITQLSEAKKPLRGKRFHLMIQIPYLYCYTCISHFSLVYHLEYIQWQQSLISFGHLSCWYFHCQDCKPSFFHSNFETMCLQISRLRLRWQKVQSRMLTRICTRTQPRSYLNGIQRKGTSRIYPALNPKWLTSWCREVAITTLIWGKKRKRGKQVIRFFLFLLLTVANFQFLRLLGCVECVLYIYVDSWCSVSFNITLVVLPIWFFPLHSA